MDGHDADGFALVVVDVQRGFEDPWWGPRDNPDCDTNLDRLVHHWVDRGRPVVLVQHSSQDPRSPLRPGQDGHRFKNYLDDVEPALLVDKSVNSAFHGAPDLHRWLVEHDVPGFVVCGITTNHCCDTTARVGGNLGHTVLFAIDATHTFDRESPDGDVVPAAELSHVTATNLHGEFATVVTTQALLGPAAKPS